MCIEKRCCKIIETKLESGLCNFRHCRSTTDQIHTLRKIFDKPWGYDSYLRVRVGGVKSQPLTMGVRLQQGCVLSPLFVIYVD